EMIGEFARSQLEDSDDAEGVGERHAIFYRDVGVLLGQGVRGSEQVRWLRRLGGDGEGDADNLRAAMAWFLRHGRLDDFADMGWALWVPAWINGQLEEGHRLAHT